MRSRYGVMQSSLADRWVVVDGNTDSVVRKGRRILYLSTPEAAAAKAAQLSTARVVCAGCRHKTLAADCTGKLCPACRELS